MENQIHILNGDALKEILPESLSGQKLVMRECLCTGNVSGNTKELFYKNRSSYISSFYSCSKDDYFSKSVKVFEEIENISKNSFINLWFEDDVFCQVNFWYTISLLEENYDSCTFYLIRPKLGCEYSFTSMNKEELLDAFTNKISLFKLELEEISKLWFFFKNEDLKNLKETAIDLEDRFPFIMKAIEAIIDDKIDNRVLNSIKETVLKKGNKDFNEIFKEFQKSEAIYGYGDLQVKTIVESL